MAFHSLTILQELEENERCIFCNRNTINEFQLGKVYRYGNVIVHYFCLVSWFVVLSSWQRIKPLFRWCNGGPLNWFAGNRSYYLYIEFQLFSSHLQQNGADEEGILGFLTTDIEKEVEKKSKTVFSSNIASFWKLLQGNWCFYDSWSFSI